LLEGGADEWGGGSGGGSCEAAAARALFRTALFPGAPLAAASDAAAQFAPLCGGAAGPWRPLAASDFLAPLGAGASEGL
jgi:hypothetical protein